MASYVYLNIDTTSPNIEIYAPSYTTVDILNEITIQADEQLSLNNTEIYIIDSEGSRQDYTFLLDGDKYVGQVKFTGYTVGSIVTIYARVADEVGNISNLVSKPIHIADSIVFLTVEIDDKELVYANVSDNQRSVESSDKAINVEVEDKEKSNVETTDRTNTIELTDRSGEIDNS